MTEEQAFAAMQLFLTGHYQATKSDDIGSLLGSMALLQDMRPMDPATWQDWLNCVAAARNGEVDNSFRLSES